MSKSSIQAWRLALGGLAWHLCPDALAQQAGDSLTLEEIIVTAQKRSESLQEVPISITVFDAQQLQAYAIDGVQDFVELTPNVGYTSHGELIGQRLAIRGVSNYGGEVNSLAVYVDELNVVPGRATATYEQELLDIERVEVLRGPQGVTFGRNVVGGAINITTKKPGPEFEAQMDAEYASFDTWLLRGSANLPLVADRMAIRATGYWRQSDGFIEDVGPGGNRNDREGSGGRLALRLTPSSAFTVDIAASHTETELGLPDLVSTGMLDPFFQQVLGITEPVDDGIGFFPQNRDKVATDSPTHSSSDTDILTARLEWDRGSYSWVSVSGYIDSFTSRVGDGDGVATNFVNDEVFEDLRSYSTELRVQSNGEERWSWLIGALYTHDEFADGFVRTLSPRFLMDIFGLTVGDSRNVADFAVFSEVDSYALFADATWRSLSKRLAISLGARYTRDDTSTLQIDTSQNLFSGDVLDDRDAGGDRFSDVSPRLSVLYELTPQVNLYTVVSRGYKSGGFNVGADDFPTAPVPASYAKETLWNYEAGLKTLLLEDRVRANLSIFYMDWSDIQVFGQVTDAELNFVEFTQNGASAASKGAELEIQAKPTSRVDLALGVGYNDAAFGSFPGALDSLGVPFDAGGNKVIAAPEWSASAAAQYTFPVVRAFEAFVRGEYAYRGKMYSDLENTETFGFAVESYDVWNLRIGLENEKYRLAAYVENVMDDDHYLGSRLFSQFSGIPVVPDPRRIGVRFTARFE